MSSAAMTYEEQKVKEAEFLRDLEGLTRKYGLRVWGCGCCGSPELMPLTEEEFQPNYHYGYGTNSEIEWTKRE